MTTAETSPTTRSAEIDVLLSCARRHGAAAGSEVAPRTLAGLDWDYIVRMALQHRVTPLVYRTLNATCREAVPPAAREQLAEQAAQSAARSRRLLDELLMLLRELAGRGIEAVPYKGPVLALSTYGDVTLRDFRDLDVLVRRGDVMRAKELLLAEGYQRLDHPTAADDAEALRSGYAFQFVRQGDDDLQVKVELHWAFAPRYLRVGLDLDGLAGRLESVAVGGSVLRTLDPEDTLFTLCVHGCKDLWQRLLMVCDVAELIRGPRSIDWDRVRQQALAVDRERMLLLGLLLARDLLDAPLPRQISARLDEDPAAHSLAVRVRERLFAEPSTPPRPFSFYVALVQK